ncbi:MAG: arginase [Bacilli bacterium]|nr:arginase [Bacilli bacterium]
MKDINFISACSDLGVHVCGSDKGPAVLTSNFSIKNYILEKENINKSFDPNDLRKNEKYINNFTKKVFDTALNILNDNKTPLLIGGDHSTVIGSALASQKYHNNIGIIWVDAHGDYNTFETTKSGNIHGLPLASITGYKCKELTYFITNNFINPKNCVVVGARSIDPWEIGNMVDAGVTIFTTKDVKNEGADVIMKKAIDIAYNNTNGVHISLDLDVIDPIIAPGVSIPEDNGISDTEMYLIVDEILKHKDIVKSIDLVELNPELDIDNKTKNIALNILNKLTK